MDDFSPSALRSITTTRLPQPRNILKKFTLSLLASSFLVQSASIKQSGLFNQTTDHLRVLNGIPDLQSCIDDNPTPYFILFYASWCGHCQHYAPIFKQFTNQTQHWHNVLRVATVDCGASANADACAKAKIQGFPTLTVYNAYHKITGDDGFVPDFTDFSFNSRNDDDLRSTIIDKILTAKNVGKDGKNSTEIENKSESDNKLENPDKHQLPWQISWNNRYNGGRICPLQPCFDTYTDIETCKKESRSWDWETTVWVYSKNTVDANTLVLSIGATYRGISAFHIDSDKEAIDIGGKIALPMETPENGKDFAKPVLDKIIELYPELRIRPENFDQKHSENEPEIVMVKEEKPEIVSESDSDEVPSNDFANAISHMINNEIVVHYIEKNAEHALGMIAILSQFGELLGLSDDEMSALQDSRLHDANVEISVFKAIKFPKETQEWSSACRGSESRYRGYPCALWRTFHALLASCAIEEEDCSEVVSTIQNYVIHFFGCTDCVKNFKDEIKEFPFEDLKTSEEQVLWLWELHNSVNKRLAGDVSEDPEHVKVQFPSEEACPECYLDDGNAAIDTGVVWDRSRVFEFLVKEYTGRTVEHVDDEDDEIDDDGDIDEEVGDDVEDEVIDEKVEGNHRNSENDVEVSDDAGVDAEVDAKSDAEIDAELKAKFDAKNKAAVEAEVNTTVDAGVDAGVNVAVDSVVDADIDPSVDATDEEEPDHVGIPAEKQADYDAEDQEPVENPATEELPEIELEHPDFDNSDAKPDHDFETYEPEVKNPKIVPGWIQKGLDDHDHADDEDEVEEVEKVADDIEAHAKKEKDPEAVSEQDANWNKLHERRINSLKRGENQKHENVQEYAEELEKLGFDEDEIHDRLRNGDIEAVKHEIELKSRQIEQFLLAFQKLVEQYPDDQEAFEEAKRRLFHKVDIGVKLNLPASDTMTHLEKLRHKDPKLIKDYAEKWSDVSHDHSDENKVNFSDIKFTYQNMAQADDSGFESSFGLIHVLSFSAVIVFMLLSRKRACMSGWLKRRKVDRGYIRIGAEKLA